MKELVEIVKETVVAKQGQDVVVIDLEHTNPFSDYFVIATALNAKHAEGLAKAVIDEVLASGYEFRCKEVDEKSSWVLVDFNGVILHVFTSDARAMYKLEKLWGDHPVEFVMD